MNGKRIILGSLLITQIILLYFHIKKNDSFDSSVTVEILNIGLWSVVLVLGEIKRKIIARVAHPVRENPEALPFRKEFSVWSGQHALLIFLIMVFFLYLAFLPSTWYQVALIIVGSAF
ncbi:MAG: hypothetical protein AB1750_16960, partial [Chloroflexota bacterium]